MEKQGGTKVLLITGGAIFLILGYVGYSFFKGSGEIQSNSSVNVETPAGKFIPKAGEEVPQAYQEKIVQTDEARAKEASKKGGSFIPTPLGDYRGIDPEEYERVKAELQKATAQIAVVTRENQNLKQQIESLQKQMSKNNATPDIPYYREGKQVLVDPKLRDERRAVMAQQLASLSQTVSPKVPLIAALPKETNAAKGESGATAEKKDLSSNNISKISLNKYIKPGEVLLASLDVQINSDVPGPVLATLQDGDDKIYGSRLIGNFKKSDDYLIVEFNRLVLGDGTVYPIQAYAVDPVLKQVSVADDVDNHIPSKIAAVFGAAWLQGIGEAYMQSASIKPITSGTNNNNGDTLFVKESAINSAGQMAIAGLSKVGEALGQILQPYANRPSTVTKYANTSIGVLFLSVGGQ